MVIKLCISLLKLANSLDATKQVASMQQSGIEDLSTPNTPISLRYIKATGCVFTLFTRSDSFNAYT